MSGKDQFSSVQSLSRVRLFATPWITARQASLSITNSRSSLRLTSIESGMPSSHLILCRPLLLLPPIPPSIRVFFNESTLHIGKSIRSVTFPGEAHQSWWHSWHWCKDIGVITFWNIMITINPVKTEFTAFQITWVKRTNTQNIWPKVGRKKGLPNARDLRDAGLIPGSGRSPGEGQGNPLQYSCLENPYGQRSLEGYSPWGCTESNTTEVT